MQPDLTTRPWEKVGTDIFKFNGERYLMVVDYYSRFPVIRLLNDMTSHTVCNHFTSIQAECGLPKWHHTTQQFSISPSSKQPSRKSNWNLQSLLRKALEENECPYTALWIYRLTPLDGQTPSPHKLLFGHKLQTTLPSSRSTLKFKHPDNDLHQEANLR